MPVLRYLKPSEASWACRRVRVAPPWSISKDSLRNHQPSNQPTPSTRTPALFFVSPHLPMCASRASHPAQGHREPDQQPRPAATGRACPVAGQAGQQRRSHAGPGASPHHAAAVRAGHRAPGTKQASACSTRTNARAALHGLPAGPGAPLENHPRTASANTNRRTNQLRAPGPRLFLAPAQDAGCATWSGCWQTRPASSGCAWPPCPASPPGSPWRSC